jgi:hypothetical protein
MDIPFPGVYGITPGFEKMLFNGLAKSEIRISAVGS